MDRERRIVFIEELAGLIGKTEATIRTCSSVQRLQHLIPRPFKLPGSRRLCWWDCDIFEWMANGQTVQPSTPLAKRGRPTKAEQRRRARS